MGQVILSTVEYDKLKKQAECFEIKKNINGELGLSIKVSTAQEIFKVLFTGSKFDDGTWEINEKESDYNDNVASYYINATKKKEPPEEEQEQPIEKVEVEGQENGN